MAIAYRPHEFAPPFTGSLAFPFEIAGFSLLGKKVFVTGGSRGIGRACALTLAAAGADVAIASSPSGAAFAETVCSEIRELGRDARAYAFDVAARGDVEETCRAIAKDFDAIDVLVNNAGVTRDRSFKLNVKTNCSGTIMDLPFKGKWRVEPSGLVLILPNKGKATAADEAPCKFEPVGDEDSLHCDLGKGIDFVVLPTRR